MKTFMHDGREWPADMIGTAKAHPGMAFGCVQEPLPTAKCGNCADRQHMHLIIALKKVQVPYQVKDGTAFFWIDSVGYTGWVRGELRAFPCPVCNGTKAVDNLIHFSGLDGDDLKIRMGDFLDMPGKKEALDLGVKILNLPKPEGFFLFYGANGRGKTLMLKAIANGYRLRNIPATFINLPDLLADIRRNFRKDSAGDAEESLYQYRARQVLCIDELDKANITDWAGETIFRIINHRHASQMLTVFATEHEPDKGNYFGSRISSGVVCKIGGDDVRQAQGLRKRKELFDGQQS